MPNTKNNINKNLDVLTMRRETIDRIKEQLSEIHRRTMHLDTIMLQEVGATAAMLAALNTSREHLSVLSTHVANESQLLTDLFQDLK